MAFAATPGGNRATKPRIEVAFVLDSTGSMGGLIEGAKQKIWSIANSIIARKPAPEVRIGLVTYRDRGDQYVTRRFDLTDDIDAVFKNLQTFAADGGGDEEESVNQALNEAVTRLAWTPDASVLKIVFLVGDCPPHMDYSNDVKYPLTCRDAAKRGIIINTVQVGSVEKTTPVWREIARLSEGEYVALAQSGNMTVVATPYDEEIARTSAALGETVVAYGDSTRREEAKLKVAEAASAPASVAADRAAFNLASGGKAIQGSGDLVADMAAGKVDPSTVKADLLPPELQKLSPSQRAAYVGEQQKKRDALNSTLTNLASQRAAFLMQEQKRLANAGAGDSFDSKVAEIIAAEAARIR
jgi:Mg-chelatase subunit ChlD